MGEIASMVKPVNQIRLEKKSIFKIHFKKYYDIPSDTWFEDAVYYYILRYLKATSLNKLFSVILSISQLVLLLLRHSHDVSMYFLIWRNVYEDLALVNGSSYWLRSGVYPVVAVQGMSWLGFGQLTQIRAN